MNYKLNSLMEKLKMEKFKYDVNYGIRDYSNGKNKNWKRASDTRAKFCKVMCLFFCFPSSPPNFTVLFSLFFLSSASQTSLRNATRWRS